MLRVCVLASGSQGNAVLIAGRETAVLIDAGLSGVKTAERVREAGMEMAAVAAILVTHEHSDHTAGVGVLARRHGLPVYIDELTLAVAGDRLGPLPAAQIHLIPSEPFRVGELECGSFPVEHDAVNPLGFTITDGTHRATVMTDTGRLTQVLKSCAQQSDILVLESNYEVELLLKSDRPWANKQRVHGNKGHLSNADAAAFIRELRGSRVREVILAHISCDHNTEGHIRVHHPEPDVLPQLSFSYQDRISGWVSID